MPGNDSDKNSRVLWKAVFANNSVGSIPSPHRSTWTGHQILQTANFNIQDWSVGASPWKSWWGGFHMEDAPIHCEVFRGKWCRYHVQAGWKILFAVKQSLLGSVDYLVENCLCKLLAAETTLRVHNVTSKRRCGTRSIVILNFWVCKEGSFIDWRTRDDAVRLVEDRNWSFLISSGVSPRSWFLGHMNTLFSHIHSFLTHHFQKSWKLWSKIASWVITKTVP